MTLDNIEDNCFVKASDLITKGLVQGVDVFQLTDTLIALELEKNEKNERSDSMLNFNDEIISIEDVGELETTDISVSGDNLFYCQGILTKNSFGLPATADLMIALISTEQLEKMNQLLVKQLKNRYNEITDIKRFTIGIERSKMRLYDIDDPLANITNTNGGPTPNVVTSPFTTIQPTVRQKFTGFKV